MLQLCPLPGPAMQVAIHDAYQLFCGNAPEHMISCYRWNLHSRSTKCSLAVGGSRDHEQR